MSNATWGENFTNVHPAQWLEFIRQWNTVHMSMNPFVGIDDPRKSLKLETHDVVASNGDAYPFTETYSVDGKVSFVVYLDNLGGRARIECFDPNLVDLCKQFYKEVLIGG